MTARPSAWRYGCDCGQCGAFIAQAWCGKCGSWFVARWALWGHEWAMVAFAVELARFRKKYPSHTTQYCVEAVRDGLEDWVSELDAGARRLRADAIAGGWRPKFPRPGDGLAGGWPGRA